MASPSGWSPEGAVGLSELTEHLVCPLCGGYFIDATTIVECLHTFCRSCILRHLETSSYCPALTCDVMIHRTKGAVSLRPDATLQSIVYKTVPGLHRNEMRRRQLFYADKPDADVDLPLALKGVQDETAGRYYAPDDTIDVRVQYASHDPDEVVPVRYLRCPAGLPLSVLKKFLFQKYRFSDTLEMELIHGRKVLPGDIRLLDVAYIVNWSRKSALKLLFRMFKPKIAAKRKLSVLEAAQEPPEKTRKAVSGSSGSVNDPLRVPSPIIGSDSKSDDLGSHGKSTPSASSAGSVVRDPQSSAEPSSERVSAQSSDPPAKSSERGASPAVVPTTVAGRAVGGQSQAQSSRIGKPAVVPGKAGHKVADKSMVSLQKSALRESNVSSRGRAVGPSQTVRPLTKSPAVRLTQMSAKVDQKSSPQHSASVPSQKPPRPPGTHLGHSYLACKMAMKLAASAANSKSASAVRSVSVGNMSRDNVADKRSEVGESATKSLNGRSEKSEATSPLVAAVTKPSGQNSTSTSENSGAPAHDKLNASEKKRIVSKVDCSVQTVPVYRIHSSKQSVTKSPKTSSLGTNTLLSATPRRTSPAEENITAPAQGAPKPTFTKPASEPAADVKEKPAAKAVLSRATPAVLDLSTHAREIPVSSGVGSTKESKTIFVISGTKKKNSNKIQSIVESLAQKRLMSSSPTQSQNRSEAATTPAKSPPATPKATTSGTNGTFAVPSPVSAKSAAAAGAVDRSVSSPLHIETGSLGLRYSSAVPPPLSGASSASSRPVFPVLPLPQRPKSQAVRSIPNPSLVRQRSAEERARDCGKGSPTAGSTAPALSPPSIRDIHSLTRQLQEAGTSVTITNTTC